MGFCMTSSQRWELSGMHTCPLAVELSISFCVVFVLPAYWGPQGVRLCFVPQLKKNQPSQCH